MELRFSKRVRLVLPTHRTETMVTLYGSLAGDYHCDHNKTRAIHDALCGCNEVGCRSLDNLEHDLNGFRLELRDDGLMTFEPEDSK